MNISKRAKEAGHAACLGLALCAECFPADAQVILLQTGGAETPVTDFRMLDAVSGPNAFVHFDFGLATAEALPSGSFLDSATISLEGASSTATTIFATLDRSSVLWAPPVPGGISLGPASILRTEIAFPEIGLSLSLPNRRAYSVTAPIPAELLGQDLTFRIDLFDNKNGVDSAAFLSAPAIVPVPEPDEIGLVTGLALVGAAFLFRLKRRNK